MVVKRSSPELKQRMEQLIEERFPDFEQHNRIVVRYGKKWKSKLGLIKPLKGRNSSKGTLIELNALLREPEVPEYITEYTLAHELVHYMHGFGSPAEKRFDKPHANGVMRKEMINRGFEVTIKKHRKWMKQNWAKLYNSHFPNKARRRGKTVKKRVVMEGGLKKIIYEIFYG